jgi:peptidoglycan/LPS O-acetylase OafA/YrhL
MSSFSEREQAALRRLTPDTAAEAGAWPDGKPTHPATLRRRLLLAIAVVLAVAGGSLVAAFAPSHTTDPDLARLLSAMGWIKGGIVLAAAAILFVRFSWPVAPAVEAGYVLALSAGAFAATMIASNAYVGPSALVFHVAALTAIVLAAVEGRRPKALLQPRSIIEPSRATRSR